jgi:hypothetical protein
MMEEGMEGRGKDTNGGIGGVHCPVIARDFEVAHMRDNFFYNPRDCGGRRSGVDRRRFNYSTHIPERRSGKDRRESLDRRSGDDRRTGEDRRSGFDRRSYEERRIGSLGRRKNGERRSGEDRRDFMIY